ncbi:MAG TPA: hypothetical protein VE981_19925 [Planctomycetota bacterium]|nr:hypothetical protein [Planctomycetota bacterium]
MIAALLLMLAIRDSESRMAEDDPKIEKVERIAGDVNRPLLWTPLKITLTSAAGYAGDVRVDSGFGFSIVREVKVAPGGVVTVIVPALDPKEITAGKTLHKMARDFVRPDHIVLVDARLPYAAELVSTPQILFQKIGAEDLDATRPRGLLEAADLILLKEASGDGPGVLAPTKEDADKAVAALKGPPPALEAVDRTLWPHAPGGGWVPAKRHWTLYFVTVYAFAAFLALAVLARRFPKFGLVCVSGVSVVGMAGYALLFPSKQLWVIGESVEAVSPAGDVQDLHVWFLNAATELETSIEFPRLVKPIFPTPGGTDDGFTLRVDGKGSRVVGLKLGPSKAACFGGAEPLPVEKTPPNRLPKPLLDTVIVRKGRGMYLGEYPADQPLPASLDGAGPAHRSSGYDAWSRFVGKEGVYGLLERETRPSENLKSPELADERERPRSWIRRFQ